jgi:aerobic carbon-monoxide dehydrogenase medium subunit
MIPAAFEYHAPKTLRQAVSTLRKYDGDARVLAGGMSLVPMMKLRLANLAAVVDLSRIEGLAYIEEADGGLAIGPMTTHYAVESSDVVARVAPLLAETAAVVGDVQVRNRGTIGGSVAHADPAADLPAALLALEATFRVAGGGRRRTVRADRMFVDAYTSGLEEGEIIAEVRVPGSPARTGWSYQKLANRASRFAVVGVAALVTADSDGTCTRVRIAVTGAGPLPSRARATERYLVGRELTPESIAKGAERATKGIEFLGDVHGSPEYREHLTSELTKRAITQASERIG